MWHSTLEMGAAYLRSVTEIAPKSPFLCLNKSPMRYGFRARLRVVPHFSSGIVERTKRERAWACRLFSRGVIFKRASSRFARSTIPGEKWGTTRSLVSCRRKSYHVYSLKIAWINKMLSKPTYQTWNAALCLQTNSCRGIVRKKVKHSLKNLSPN